MKSELVIKAIDAVLKSDSSFCKFLSANDSGETGSNQSGILISRSAVAMLFTELEMQNNHILKKNGRIRWHDEYDTPCTITWYKSKGEIRITGFLGKSPLCPELTGALFVLVKDTDVDYQGFFLNTDDDIQEFLDFFGLTPAETNRPIEPELITAVAREKQAIDEFISDLKEDFPSTLVMAQTARNIQNDVYHNRNLAVKDPDTILLNWTNQEYRLFRELEKGRYGPIIKKGFPTVDSFTVMANMVLNRRRSRAGKSLEHHLSAIFDENKIEYAAQAVTEGKKKPDFLFPSVEAYHDMNYPISKLCTLSAKRTCKDRWRQILNEADRLNDENKYLCTMQQGISAAQMDEMKKEKVILVVPKAYHSAYPKDRRDRLWTLGKFISHVRSLTKQI